MIFSWYYQEYMIRTYGNQLSQLAGAQFVVRGVRPFGAETVVSSEFFLPNGARYQVDWYLIDRGGEYKISDMAIDGVSMKAANRDEVARWIERNGGRFGAVLAVLRQQLGITDY